VIVWDYVGPYYKSDDPTKNMIYRAYRVPYEWVPQVAKPVEQAVTPPPNATFRVGATAVNPSPENASAIKKEELGSGSYSY
jgi:hypothetical protein